ncbi:hypothetical protein R3P38DRAFT_2800287 [Favolaschia claudopus]|uniref:Uncharacterized protein n=1 Tax=Favolaschia claudopus TaxID=2862362 RepID=A0AAV9ZZ44_9AGAR
MTPHFPPEFSAPSMMLRKFFFFPSLLSLSEYPQQLHNAFTIRIDVPRAGLRNFAAGRLTPPPTRKAGSLLAPSPPPRREAAPTPLTIRIAFPRTTAFAPELWLPAGKYPPRRLQQRYPQLSFKTFVVVVAAAPRSGAIASTRPITVRRAGIFNVWVSLDSSRLHVTHVETYRRPASVVVSSVAVAANINSTSKLEISSSPERHLLTKLHSQNLNFSAARHSSSIPRPQIEIRDFNVHRPTLSAVHQLQEFSSPAARATSSSSAPPSRLGNSRFRGPASEPLSSVVFSARYLFSPLRGASRPTTSSTEQLIGNSRFGVPASEALSLRVYRIFLSAARRPPSEVKTIKLFKSVKSSKSKKIFFAARPTHLFLGLLTRSRRQKRGLHSRTFSSYHQLLESGRLQTLSAQIVRTSNLSKISAVDIAARYTLQTERETAFVRVPKSKIFSVVSM